MRPDKYSFFFKIERQLEKYRISKHYTNSVQRNHETRNLYKNVKHIIIYVISVTKLDGHICIYLCKTKSENFCETSGRIYSTLYKKLNRHNTCFVSPDGWSKKF